MKCHLPTYISFSATATKLKLVLPNECVYIFILKSYRNEIGTILSDLLTNFQDRKLNIATVSLSLSKNIITRMVHLITKRESKYLT
jgi:hypothetical protein